MQRFTLLFSLFVVCFLTALQAQAPAPKPGPEHKKVGVFVGHWTFTGEYKAGPLGPGGPVTGEYTGQMILGGFFLQGHWVEKGPLGTARGFETFGYDPANKNYFQSQYMDNGSIGSGVFTVNGNTWNYSGKIVAAGKQYMWRGTFTFAVDLTGIDGKTEISDGNTWTPFWEVKFTKVKPTAKK
jgi:hypothetical protein